MDWGVAGGLAAEAGRFDERRLLVLAGGPDSEPLAAARQALDAAAVPMAETSYVGPESALPCEHVPFDQADSLLGTTRDAVVLDCRTACRPNVLGTVVGAVDGGGLLLLLTPPLDDWARRRDDFDETLAVPPDSLQDVTGHFRSRLVQTLRVHPGIAILDLDTDTVQQDGLTDSAPRLPPDPIQRPPGAEAVPQAIVDACVTQDQVDAIAELAALRSGPRAAVLEADRGRGKSSVAGLLAAWFAAEGERILVTGPSERAAEAFFDRVEDLLGVLDPESPSSNAGDRTFETTTGGCIRFVSPTSLSEHLESADVLFVEEAAALPVSILESTLAVDRLVFTTTVHGYEGSGRGFAVRFRDSLEQARHDLQEVSLVEPIRYAAGDPIESWASRALLLGAGPVPGSVIETASPESVSYRSLDSETLLAEEQLLREVFGLLVSAHYRTEPDDLARLLDGSNLAVRALLQDGHVVSVALVAREGGLPKATREQVSHGERIRGNMLPDVLMSQLRDEDAGGPVGIRVVRIATHHAVRGRGLGSHLLDELDVEFAPVVDWIGSGFGATPELVRFWRENGFRAVHLSTGRNERSGEHSVLVIRGTSPVGHEIETAHGSWFAGRIRGVLRDALSEVDPDVIRATLAATAQPPPLSITPHQWRVIAGAAFGPGLYSVDPEPFRKLIAHALIDGGVDLSDTRERLLVEGLLQGRPWEQVATDLEYVSRAAAMRALGRALQPLVREYGSDVAQSERRRYEN
ncbi:tRNA(Met) cytidine acetyltransferase TmcA [Halodesulfurarchaeum formicicum]|uniref:tRNA(Met) cytidine acetyltransferase TmcA n=1 Tax=Halodesulfurarchaeum formicicum TaxID=1873524 RepID=A0A1J1ABS7_9EURY|nr:tRNA(Met) cytidine acetyltransferase TmcA [Halodesulfurarchaeum formicicum]APE95243.1 bifunctional p-loop ATPase/acetyltransferase [Halodesulfurarchaeum formicicum]